MAGEERLVFMTTNHLERLDPALVRPGRVDAMYHVGAATRPQIAQLFCRFYGAGAAREADVFAAQAHGRGLSMAALQGFFMLNRASAEQAMAHLPALLASAPPPPPPQKKEPA